MLSGDMPFSLLPFQGWMWYNQIITRPSFITRPGMAGMAKPYVRTVPQGCRANPVQADRGLEDVYAEGSKRADRPVDEGFISS